MTNTIHVTVKGTSGLGVASLVLGIVAILIAWVPFLGLLAIPLACIGLFLAVIGFFISLIGGRSGVGMPVSGGILCALAIILSIASTGTAVGIGAAASNYRKIPTTATTTTAPAVDVVP